MERQLKVLTWASCGNIFGCCSCSICSMGSRGWFCWAVIHLVCVAVALISRRGSPVCVGCWIDAWGISSRLRDGWFFVWFWNALNI